MQLWDIKELSENFIIVISRNGQANQSMACILNNILFMRLCPSCFTLNACALNVQYVNNHKSEESELALFTYVICFIRFCRFALNREGEREREIVRASASICVCSSSHVFVEKIFLPSVVKRWKWYLYHSILSVFKVGFPWKRQHCSMHWINGILLFKIKH